MSLMLPPEPLKGYAPIIIKIDGKKYLYSIPQDEREHERTDKENRFFRWMGRKNIQFEFIPASRKYYDVWVPKTRYNLILSKLEKIMGAKLR